MPAAIRLLDVTKQFDGTASPAVGHLSLDVEEGTIVALLGPSGCGKTTTLRMINRLIEPTSGTIEVNGINALEQSPQQLRRGIGFVIQQVGLFPHRTIAANIATVPELLGWDRDRITARIDELAALVGLDDELLHRYPDELSGGQQQRVGVARALAADPPVLLMDEPFGAVDPIVRTRLQDELVELQRRLHKTIVLVTHDLDEALRVADRIALMNTGGVVEQLAAPDELLRAPANAFVEEFLGADRGMRRLALNTVGSLPFHQGPVAPVSAGYAEVAKVLDDSGSDWLGLTDGDHFLGWVEGPAALAGTGAGRPLSGLEPSVPAAQATPDDTLRAAMELIMSSNTAVAVIDDGGRFGGVVTLEDIRRALTDDTADGALHA